MKNQIKAMRNSSFMKLTSWTLLAQLVVFILSPITTRLFTVKQFGEYTLITSVIGMVVPVISLKFDSLIVTEKEDQFVEKASFISYISIFIVSLFTSLFYYIYCFFSSITIDIYQIIIMFFILVITGISNIGVAYSNRFERYTEIGKYNFIRSLSQNILLVSVGYIGYGINGMLLTMFVGNFFGFKKIMKNVPRLKDILKRYVGTYEYFKSNISLLKYSFPAHFINSLSYTLINFLIVSLYSTEIFGYYSLAFRVLGLPLMVVTQNMSKIFFKEASDEWNNTNEYTKALKKATLILTLLSLPMVIILLFFSPSLFSLIFGSSWEKTGRYVQILVPMFGIRLIVSSLMSIFIVINKQRKELYFQIMFLIVSVIVFLLCKYLSVSVDYFLFGISMFYSLIYIYIYIYIFKNRRV